MQRNAFDLIKMLMRRGEETEGITKRERERKGERKMTIMKEKESQEESPWNQAITS